MQEILDVLLLSVFGSATVLGLFSFVVKKYIEKYMSHEFSKRTKDYEITLEQQRKFADFLTDGQLGIYREITEVVYRIRNIVRDGAQESSAYKWDQSLKPYCAHLTENLYKYRLFLPGHIFQLLHDFKKLAQDVMVKIDIFTRDEMIKNDKEYLDTLPILKKESEKIDELHEEIIFLIEKHINKPKEK